MHENEVAKIIVDVAFQIHTKLGPGLLESVYEAVMMYELKKRGLHVENQVAMPVEWDGIRLNLGFRPDLIVEHCVIVEVKAIQAVAPLHKKVLLTYLRLSDKRLELSINFGVELIKDGISRIVNHLED